MACYKLTGIAAPLMNHLKAMMQVVQDQHNQIRALKQELSHYKVGRCLFCWKCSRGAFFRSGY